MKNAVTLINQSSHLFGQEPCIHAFTRTSTGLVGLVKPKICMRFAKLAHENPAKLKEGLKNVKLYITNAIV